jgi:hypothetical protein
LRAMKVVWVVVCPAIAICVSSDFLKTSRINLRN